MAEIGAAKPPKRLAMTQKRLQIAADRRSNGAVRAARRRARLRRCTLVASVEVDPAILDVLIALRWLPATAAESRAEIEDAIHRLLSDLAQHSQ